MSLRAAVRLRRRYFLPSLAVLALDQSTKLVAHGYLRERGAVEIIPDLFNLWYSRNPGGLFGFFVGWMRDPMRYFLAVFGQPAEDVPWGMRFDGHHLSLNWTAIPGAPLSATPLFLGGQPRVVPPEFERAGLRVLPDEEDAAVAFLIGLSEQERQIARIPWQEGSQIRRPMSIGGEVELELTEWAGLSRSALAPAARARFDALVEVHLANFAPLPHLGLQGTQETLI